MLLGHPTVAFVTILSALLLALAAGSLASERVRPETHRRAAVLVVLATVGAAWLLPPGVEAMATSLQSAGTVVRAAFVFALVGVVATPLGVLLPSMLRTAKTTGITPSACWAINGLASVAGSVLANLLVRGAGFAATGQITLAVYGVAGLCWLAALPRSVGATGGAATASVGPPPLPAGVGQAGLRP